LWQVFGQEPPPIADPVEIPLLPSGISEFDIELNARLVSMFKADDGMDALHFLDDFVLEIGNPDTQSLRSREAVVWLSERTVDGRSYRNLQVFLWKDAEVSEFGGTVTLSPVFSSPWHIWSGHYPCDQVETAR
jgi:hypothetical protein